MPEEIVRGRSLDDIRHNWAQQWNCSPEDIQLEVLDKPGLLSRQWRVKVSYTAVPLASLHADGLIAEKSEPANVTTSRVQQTGEEFVITPGEGVTRIFACRHAGDLAVNGETVEESCAPQPGKRIEYRPLPEPGELTWELEVRFQGISAIAKVKHKRPGRYVLPAEISSGPELHLEDYLQWQDLPPTGEFWNESKLDADLQAAKVVFGRKPDCWAEIMMVENHGEVVVAEATLPVPPQPAQLEDFVGAIQPKQSGDDDQKQIDFFASKVKLVQEGAVLARKVPAVQGVAGKDVYGRVLPVATPRDFQLRVKKNAKLSDDGLEVIATCSGQPVRLDEITYGVENVYVLQQDVELKTGSIEFPGDVFVNGNVQDGLHIFAGGKVEIQGSVAKAEVRAEKGIKIRHNVIGGRLVVGEKFVVRSEILRLLKSLYEDLGLCLAQTEELTKSTAAKNIKPGLCLKQVLERQFPELPKLAAQAENYLLSHNDELIGQDLIVSVRTAKHFLGGLGPLDLQAIPFLQRVHRAFGQFIENIALVVPDKLVCAVDYVQGAKIECGGSFECAKGAYNSVIHTDGDITIGVCRGGRVSAGGNLTIKELGGSEVSATFVQIYGRGRLRVTYCHPNVIIAVDKEIIRIEEAYRNLEIYKERGVVQVEKLRANPL